MPRATICSIMKTIELRALDKTMDPSWDGVNLAIWSATELSVGVLIASLPPLRKQFDKLFHAILPSTLLGSRSRSRSKPPSGIPMYTISKHQSVSNPMRRSRMHEDDDSERSILPESDGRDGITKTVVHEIINEERRENEERENSVQSPRG